MFISFSFIACKRERNEPKKEKNANFTASQSDAKNQIAVVKCERI